MNFFTIKEGVENYAGAGKAKTDLPIAKMLLLGILAGFLIGIPALVTNVAGCTLSSLTEGNMYSIVRVVSGILFAFGLGTVVLTGAELFTGNTLIIISVADKRTSFAKMLKNWVFVYIGNFIGSLLVAFLTANFNWMSGGNGSLGEFTMSVAQSKMTMPFQNAFVMGILCNALVVLGVMLSLQGKSIGGRVLGAWIPVMFFVTCGFNHSIADMTYCMAGLFAKSQAAFADVAGNFANLTWGNYFLGNMIPVTLGNIVGGCAIGLLFWYCNLKKSK